jgi:hypothetical protein
MAVSASKKQHNTKAESRANNPHGFMTHAEYKQKLLHERPDVKKEYDALEPEYQREVAETKKAISKRKRKGDLQYVSAWAMGVVSGSSTVRGDYLLALLFGNSLIHRRNSPTLEPVPKLLKMV